MILIFLGAPGSGKDTQAQLLKSEYGYEVISTGELFRKAIASGSALGKEIKDKYDKGLLMTDQDVINVLEDYFKGYKSQNLILTGVVRTFPQISILDNVLSKYSFNVKKVFYFDISDKTVLHRITNRLVCDIDNSIVYHKIFNPPPAENACTLIGGKLVQRDDDRAEVVQTRLDEFHNKSTGILEEYDKRGILSKINAEVSIEEIHQLVLNELGLE